MHLVLTAINRWIQRIMFSHSTAEVVLEPVFLPPNFYCLVYMALPPPANYGINYSSDMQAGMYEIFEPRWMLDITSRTTAPWNPSTVIIVWALRAAGEFGIFSVNTHIFIFPCVFQARMVEGFSHF